MEQSKKVGLNVLTLVIIVIGTIVIGVTLTLFLRFQRGLIGILASILVTTLLIYWLREIKNIIKNEFSAFRSKRDGRWIYDIIDRKGEITLVGEVPGPEHQINIKVMEGMLEVLGGRNFKEKVDLREKVEIIGTTYRNGVLNIKFKKIDSKS